MAYMKKRTRAKIDAGATFDDLLAREFPTPAERAAFEADVEGKLAAAQALAQVEFLRKRVGVTKAAMAARMCTPAPVLSRLTNAKAPNPTFATFGRALKAVGLTATIRISKARAGEAPLKVAAR